MVGNAYNNSTTKEKGSQNERKAMWKRIKLLVWKMLAYILARDGAAF